VVPLHVVDEDDPTWVDYEGLIGVRGGAADLDLDRQLGPGGLTAERADLNRDLQDVGPPAREAEVPVVVDLDRADEDLHRRAEPGAAEVLAEDRQIRALVVF